MKFEEYKGLNLPKVAEEVLSYWKEKDIFEKSISSREGKERYVFFEGPPSANGMQAGIPMDCQLNWVLKRNWALPKKI
jgi:isoleucyl-tRNA synthetase